MDSKNSFEIDSNQILRITATLENYSPEAAVGARSYLSDILKSSGCAKFLLDITKAKDLPETMKLFESGLGYAEMRTFVQKMAIVYSAKFEDKVVWLETVARNRGLNTRVFTDLSEADKWLLE